MAVCRIQGEADILIDTIPLRSVLILAADHVTLQDEGLHLVTPGRHQSTGLAMQVDQLIALVHMEGSYIFRLCHKGLLLHPRLCCQCRRLISQIPDFIPLILSKGDRLYHTDAALIASRVSTAAIQCPGGLRFIKTAVRIVGHHGVAGF